MVPININYNMNLKQQSLSYLDYIIFLQLQQSHILYDTPFPSYIFINYYTNSEYYEFIFIMLIFIYKTNNLYHITNIVLNLIFSDCSHSDYKYIIKVQIENC